MADLQTVEHMVETPVLRVPTTTSAVVGITVFNLFMLIISISSVEQMIDRNETHAEQESESGRASWSFGQILAMILLIGPVFAFSRLLKDRVMEWYTKHQGLKEEPGSPSRQQAERNYRGLEDIEARDVKKEKTLLGMRTSNEKGTPEVTMSQQNQ